MPHRIIQSWYTGCWWVGCYIWYSEDGTGWAAAPPSPLLAVPNVTAHPSAASVPITVLLYDGPLLCSFNVGIKGLSAYSKVINVFQCTSVWARRWHQLYGDSEENNACVSLSLSYKRCLWLIKDLLQLVLKSFLAAFHFHISLTL